MPKMLRSDMWIKVSTRNITYNLFLRAIEIILLKSFQTIQTYHSLENLIGNISGVITQSIRRGMAEDY